MEFSIRDFMFADVITLRNGERYVYADGFLQGEQTDYACDCQKVEHWYDEGLICKDAYGRLHDIVKIERAGKTVFEIKENI